MNTAIEIKNLSFKYNTDFTLKDITLSINQGDFACIIGPNGSGKSTLLKSISNILEPDAGEIKIFNKKLNQYKSKELAKRVALVPQDTIIDYNFSVFDIVLMGRSPYIGRFERESPKDYQSVNEALILTDTFHLENRVISEISGGERQRVIIARAIAQDSDIILLDEPTSHLDINHQIEILTLLKRLNEERGVTIILVIHDINLAARFGKTLILVNDGEIIKVGSPAEVITKDNMSKAYDINIVINYNSLTDSPYIIPLSAKEKVFRSMDKNKKIHVLCGGGTGEEIINSLNAIGYDVSLGVINMGDSDWKLGKKLFLKMVEEAPFTGISEEAYMKNKKMIMEADLIVLTSVPYGRGNLMNLQLAYEALKEGKEIYLVDNYIKDRSYDYVNGKASKLLNDMKKNSLHIVDSVNKLIKAIDR